MAKNPTPSPEQSPSTVIRGEITVVGAGVSGIGMGIALLKAGFKNFVILDRGSDLGGTWRDHTYPGLTIDVPALTYSYSFAQKPDWSSLWAPQAEMLDYLREVADKYGVREHLRLNEEVVSAEYDPARNEWITRTRGGTEYVSTYLINGSGYLSTPKTPDIPGLESFAGTLIHSGQWSQAGDLTGKRVALIGTGATGIQLAPQLADFVDQLHVFQRTPIWLLPKPAMKVPRVVKGVFRFVPGAQRAARLYTSVFMDLVFFRVFTNYPQVAGVSRLAARICRKHIRKQVHDEKLQEALTPTYSWGCKRPSFSNNFYPAFNEPHVELVTEPIEQITSDAIVTKDRVTRPVDAIICATGYQPFEKSALPTYAVIGAEGVELSDFWDKNRYQAYRGFAVPSFPNFFLVFGPYSIASPSYFATVEVAARNIVRCLTAARKKGADYIEVSAEANEKDLAAVLAKKSTAIWNTANCGESRTFYIDRFGDSPGFRPSYHHIEWWKSRTLSTDAFRIERRAARQEARS